MKINIKGTDLLLTPSIKEYIEMRVAPLEKYLGATDEGDGILAHVEISRTTRHHGKGDVYRTEINIDVNKNIARAEQTGEDIRATIDEASLAIKHALVKYKEKHASH